MSISSDREETIGFGLVGIGHKVEKNAAASLTRLILGSTDHKEPQP